MEATVSYESDLRHLPENLKQNNNKDKTNKINNRKLILK